MTKKSLVFILICTLLCVGIATGVSYWVLPTEYVSTITMITVGTNSQEDSADAVSTKLSTGLSLRNDYINIVKTSEVLEEVKNQVANQYPEFIKLNNESIVKKISVEALPNTRIFKISYIDTTPDRSQLITNKLGEVLIRRIKSYMKIDTLQVLNSAEIIGTLPNIPKNALIALLFGFFMAVILTLSASYLKSSK